MKSRDAQAYLEIGDRLLRRGKIRTAAAVYVRGADAFLAETCFAKARECVVDDPITALRVLARAEQIVGPTGEGRWLSARAYWKLGQPEIARNFLLASR